MGNNLRGGIRNEKEKMEQSAGSVSYTHLAGPIGNLVAQAAKGMGAAKVMITDVSDLRLDKAKECGIDVCVNTKEKDFGEAMVEAFGPDKADVIYDCAGNNITMGQAIKYARKGSVIVLVAVFAGMEMCIRDSVYGSHECKNCNDI